MGQHKGSVIWSLVLHIAVLAVLMTGIALPQRPRVEIATAPIVGTIVDTAALERQQKARDDAARQERQRQQREDRERREVAEQQRQAQQREEQRVAAEQRARDDAAQKERDRVAADKAAAERREQQAREQQRERDAQAQRERDEAAKRERERQAVAAAQRQREQDMLAAAAREGEANAARESGLYDQYVFAIQQRIKSKWQRPLSARAGIDCVVTVVQLPTGDVVSAKVASCNGDEAVRQSIERAVLAASPLPKAPTPAVYERNVNVRFQPEE